MGACVSLLIQGFQIHSFELREQIYDFCIFYTIPPALIMRFWLIKFTMKQYRKQYDIFKPMSNEYF